MFDTKRVIKRSKETVEPESFPPPKRVLRSTSLRVASLMQRVSDLLEELTGLTEYGASPQQLDAKKMKRVDSGVGFGGTHADEQLLTASKYPASYAQARRDNAMLAIFSSLIQALREVDGFEVDDGLLAMLSESCLPLIICDLLRNGSLLDIGRRAALYRALLDLIVGIQHQPLLAPLLHLCKESSDASPLHLLGILDKQSQIFFTTMPSSTADDEAFFQIARSIHNVYEMVAEAAEMAPTGEGVAQEGLGPEDTLKIQYTNMFRKECFKQVDMKQEGSHYYMQLAQKAFPISRVVRQRMAELAALSNSLPSNWDGSIAVRMDESDCSLLKVLIVGPTGTPYANGCFIFDVFLPPMYPAEPPKVHLITTQPSTRLNPNLYADGSVCLSLLGTWAGPGWIADTSTLLQVLVSIHALIFVPDPYFNEPGYETRKGTTAGDLATAEYSQRIRTFTAKLAILEQLKKPSPCFASLIQEHFFFKRLELVEQLESWATDMAVHSFGAKGKMEHWNPADIITEIKMELEKLPHP